jgi:hypothetical protein
MSLVGRNVGMRQRQAQLSASTFETNHSSRRNDVRVDGESGGGEGSVQRQSQVTSPIYEWKEEEIIH